MKTKTQKAKRARNGNGGSRCVQRVVRRLLATWNKRLKQYDAQEKSLAKQGLYAMAHGCVTRKQMCREIINDLEWEMPPNAPHEPQEPRK